MTGDGLSSDLPGRVDAILAAAVDAGQVPGVVAGVARGQAEHIAVAGSMAFDGPPMTRDTLFRISSMTKPMTAALVLALVDAGRLGLDDPVETFLPELADRLVLRRPDGPLSEALPADRAITVRDLLTFTWGFGMQGAMFEAAEPWSIFTAAESLHTFGPPTPDLMPDPDSWMARLGELPLLAQPGERWLYQTGSQVLGVLAARVAGMPFDQALSERLLSPLGMVDTGFHATDPSRLATAYEVRNDALAVSDPPDGQWSRPPRFPDGSAGLISTVDDVLSFGRMLLGGGGSVLRPATVVEMTRNQLTRTQLDNAWPGFSFLDGRGWGYGLSIQPDGAYGWDGGLGSTWINDPAADLTVVVLTQRATGPTGPAAVLDEVVTAARAG